MKNGFETALEGLKAEVGELEEEWNKLDTQGTGTVRQQEISKELESLNKAIEWAEKYLKQKGERK